MAAYLITYDLTNDAAWSKYSDLTTAIEKRGGLNCQKSVWLLQSNDSARSLYDEFRKYMAEDDRLYVAELAKGGSWISKSFKGTNDWMTRNVGPSR